MVFLDDLKADLKHDEGSIPWGYKDSLGYLTIGVGRLIDHNLGGKLSDDEIDYLLNNDVNKCYSDVKDEPWYLALDTDNRRRAVLNMRFQLGSVRLRGFKSFLGLLTASKWQEAGDDLKSTLWYRQVPDRARRIENLIRNG